MNRWKNTLTVLKWYNKIPSKTQFSFIKFDIESFYPSITQGLMNKAKESAKTIVDIPNEELSVIMQSQKTLFGESATGKKKKRKEQRFSCASGMLRQRRSL